MSVTTIPPVVGAGGLALILQQRLGADGTITFSNIPQTYRDLVLSYDVRSTTTPTDNLKVQCGHGSLDTGANYGELLNYNGSSSGLASSGSDTSALISIIQPSNETAAYFSGGWIEFIDYRSTTKTKNFVCAGAFYGVSVAAYYSLGIGTWKNTTQAIDIMKFLTFNSPGTMKSGSVVTLWGRG